jgi:hypothetical protein
MFSAKPSTPLPISAAHDLGSHAEFCKGCQSLDGSGGRGGSRGANGPVIGSILLKIGKG